MRAESMHAMHAMQSDMKEKKLAGESREKRGREKGKARHGEQRKEQSSNSQFRIRDQSKY